ncbi:hypothetical protein SAMN04487944_101472 [Gracilibacillus ureilyticus]|uniref:Competence protein ComGE n=1 Tax=Gracilibacillus ureilyticus TaxID=531814 RepID=A0A1H9LZC7_9BACI|nr:hypothetical protein [Gracilibacillus ureilyticus]SER16679.1 hypothetical protein SAMN04487944_101472 [Gracilibacillus ureilyticus]
MLEAVLAIFIFFSILFTLLPLIYQLKLENQKLLDRSIVTHQLYQTLITEDISPAGTYHDWIGASVILTIDSVPPYRKGCATWTNVKTNPETICLYSY